MFADVSVAEGQCILLDIHSFLCSFGSSLAAPATRVQMKLHVCSGYMTCLDIPVWLGQFWNQNLLASNANGQDGFVLFLRTWDFLSANYSPRSLPSSCSCRNLVASGTWMWNVITALGYGTWHRAGPCHMY